MLTGACPPAAGSPRNRRCARGRPGPPGAVAAGGARARASPVCSGVAKSRSPPNYQRRRPSPAPAVAVLVRARPARRPQLAAGPEEVGARVAEDRAACCREEAAGGGSVGCARPRRESPDLRSGKTAAPASTGARAPPGRPPRLEPAVDRRRGRDRRAASVEWIRPKKAPMRTFPVLIGGSPSGSGMWRGRVAMSPPGRSCASRRTRRRRAERRVLGRAARWSVRGYQRK